MQNQKNENKALSLTVTEGLSVTVLPNADHEFLMTTKEVALGYDTSEYAIRKSLLRNNSEFIEGKHFITAGTFCPRDHQSALRLPHNATLWTKRGIVRLGFFIKSERARLFRDWAEELILTVSSQQLSVNRALPAKRNHNRLTAERLIDIMADVCRIDDKDLRISITSKLLGKEACDGDL